jgi:hypothetical protein
MSGTAFLAEIRNRPHWKVRFKPSEFLPERLASLRECNRAVEQSRVVMRGWDYPHFSMDENERGRGQNWISSKTAFNGHIEYWRLYQSAQFIHYFVVQEVANEEWAEECLKNLMGHLPYLSEEDFSGIRGAFSLKNFTWTIAEIFEFAARLYEHIVGIESFSLEISLVDCQGLALAADQNRCWPSLYRLSNDCTYELEVDLAALVASEREMTEKAVSWFFERFGWDVQSVAMIRKDLQELFRS